MSRPLSKNAERITQQQMEARIAAVLDMPKAQVKRVVDTLIELIKLECENKRTFVITFRDFGRFWHYQRKCPDFSKGTFPLMWTVRFKMAYNFRPNQRRDTVLGIKKIRQRSK